MKIETKFDLGEEIYYGCLYQTKKATSIAQHDNGKWYTGYEWVVKYGVIDRIAITKEGVYYYFYNDNMKDSCVFKTKEEAQAFCDDLNEEATK